MLSRRHKALFYSVAGPLMAVNAWRVRVSSPRRDGPLRVQLGPGQSNYLEGWVNVDANMFTARCDIWADLRRRLPFPPSSVDAFYSHHVVEHLQDLPAHFADVQRCLKPGGVYRVGGPNGDAAMRKYLEQDSAWFLDFPDKRTSIGGRFENFIFCRQEHLTILTRSYLEELLTAAGFDNIQTYLPARETGSRELFTPCLAIEEETDFAFPHTLIIEARKPVSA